MAENDVAPHLDAKLLPDCSELNAFAAMAAPTADTRA